MAMRSRSGWVKVLKEGEWWGAHGELVRRLGSVCEVRLFPSSVVVTFTSTDLQDASEPEESRLITLRGRYRFEAIIPREEGHPWPRGAIAAVALAGDPMVHFFFTRQSHYEACTGTQAIAQPPGEFNLMHCSDCARQDTAVCCAPPPRTDVFHVFCSNCGQSTGTFQTRETAVRVWNARQLVTPGLS